MGSNCSQICNCYGKKADDKHEDDLSTPIAKAGLEHLRTSSQQSFANITDRQEHAAIILQKNWKGHQSRQRLGLLRAREAGSSKYFTHAETIETLSNNRYKSDMEREERPTYTFKSRSEYTGEWKGGFRDGFGSQEWPDGAKYEGDWVQGHAHGKGKFWHVDGDVYEGMWKNNKANGLGVYKHKEGSHYLGEWKDDLQHGKGTETWNDNSKYDGEYIKGQKHGFGTYTWVDQSRYSGEWFENKINGLGIYFWKDGRRYEGQWKENEMEGYGTQFYQEGNKYHGEFAQDKKHGFGRYSWTDGRSYEGYWHQGKQHGLGKYHTPEKKETRLGLWENGKRIEWFDEEMIEQINARQKHYSDIFENVSSAEKIVYGATFKRPEGFDYNIN